MGENLDFTADPPRYETKGKQQASQDDSEASGNNETVNEGFASYDKRAKYAIRVQKACTDALQRVVKNNMLMHSNWAAPLAAAPTAISVMAICLKTAAEKKAAGLEIADLKVTDESGNEVIGTLPSDAPNS